jgi:hypothetical protein
MQPITQASLDPKLNNIRHLLAEQLIDEAIGYFGLEILNRGTERVLRCGEGARRWGGLSDLADIWRHVWVAVNADRIAISCGHAYSKSSTSTGSSGPIKIR